ncbi:hypothetical protein TVAG_008110 [Trichomonas vaginalis G3]|uniref:KN homeodomain domain-containing protein n=1 Tax=Trichomonas vaginalis (strain ATCC PRA-98 / G3) TaxID=412133 RepID=A2EX26_TRIV3|nr:DNA binding [Trichomonas vaginalis G3]EAY02803.1 hypothetical protein TVAG_008110 [Trichomonas vaginalis G3]KAI5537569.1 DNA binding [Trichomonas vaginalis G3]|eukprot:XP_001315026.1 hypothetical protein [Trichomonas vaginalis G3]
MIQVFKISPLSNHYFSLLQSTMDSIFFNPFLECDDEATEKFWLDSLSQNMMDDDIFGSVEDIFASLNPQAHKKETKAKEEPATPEEEIKQESIPTRKGARFSPKYSNQLVRYGLKRWVYSHSNNPYPTKDEKAELCRYYNISMKYLDNFMRNMRQRRHLSTRVRALYK